MTHFLHFEQALFPCIGPVLLDWIERTFSRVLPTAVLQISCAYLPIQVRLSPCKRQANSCQSSDCRSLLRPAFAALGANGSESIQRRVR